MKSPSFYFIPSLIYNAMLNLGVNFYLYKVKNADIALVMASIWLLASVTKNGTTYPYHIAAIFYGNFIIPTHSHRKRFELRIKRF